MSKSVIIAVDAMGGDNSPSKILQGISEYIKKNNNIYLRIFGNKTLITNEVDKNKINKNNFEIIECDDVVKNNETPLSAAKRKNTSLKIQL